MKTQTSHLQQISVTHREMIENISLVSEELAVALPKEVLERLLLAGHLKAFQLRPLHARAKKSIQYSCLRRCEDTECHRCIFQNTCEASGKRGR